MSSDQKIPDYKSTIRLPQTDFPMKGNLPQKEPELIKFWSENKIYHKIIEKNHKKKNFVLPDGPPYANGSIHIGHALNKILKDIIIKYKNMRGYCSPFVPGWDCHGLPIEHKVMKQLADKKIQKSDQEILALCRAEASYSIDIQKEQFRRLGVLAEWENPYLTMAPDYEAEEIREFARAYKNGSIYRGSKPVYWNWVLKTALADAEVEYHNHKSPSIYVKFPVTDIGAFKKIGFSASKPLSIVIWTTTPWTLPANLGICLHPDFEYGVYDIGNEYLFIAKGLKESFAKETGLELNEVCLCKGESLEYGKARHPFLDRDSQIVLGLHVSLDAGTGCVHTAPGHGADDFKVGMKYNLGILCPVDDSGCFTSEVPEFKGMNIFKANPLIIEKLKASGNLIKGSEIEHSYPHCWRSKTPLIFRTTPQWFISMDQESTNIRGRALKSVDEIKFYPAWGEARFRAMMEGRPDWCLSRQRLWGVPIPVFYCIATGEPLIDYDIMMKVADVIENEGGIDAFFKHEAEYFTGKIVPQGEFGSKGFRQSNDILDVWFDSGICHAAVQSRRPHMHNPADLYLEGSDQHRGWFNTSLLSSIASHGKAPFKALVTHGFVTDPQGRKMSKSLGNVVDPQDVSSKSGAEILRLWSIYEDYGKDITCGAEVFNRLSETYRRIRNTMRFILGTLNDFDPSKDIVAYKDMTPLDQWALNELADLNMKVIQSYDSYDFYKIYHLLNNFFTVTLSSVYLDVLKDRLYTWKANGVARRSAQTSIYYIADYLIRMMAPSLSFLAEETYSYMKGPRKESVFLTEFPEPPSEWVQPQWAVHFSHLLKVRTDVQKQLEELRNSKTIGASLEAHVEVDADGDLHELLSNTSVDMRELLIVSDFKLNKGPYKVMAVRADGEKCVRCWTYSTQISNEGSFPGICPKCIEALS